MNILIAILSRWGNEEKRQAQRETWLAERDPDVDYRFFVGRLPVSSVEEFTVPEIEDDVIPLDCPDDRAGLSQKVKAVASWAQSAQYDFVFKCDDDSYLVPSRLLASGFEEHDHSGFIEDRNLDLATTFRVYPHAQGGPGYWLRRRALVILVAQMIDKKHQEELAVAETLAQHDIEPFHDDRYRQGPDFDVATFISVHPCDSAAMRAIHATVKKFLPDSGLNNSNPNQGEGKCQQEYSPIPSPKVTNPTKAQSPPSSRRSPATPKSASKTPSQ